MQKTKLENFFKYFPESMVCISNWDKSQKEQDKENFMPIKKFWYDTSDKEIIAHNSDPVLRHPVYFTPCSVKAARHKKENFKDIRAWYIDIDVVAKDEVVTEEEVADRKAEALGRITFCEDEEGDKKVWKPTFVVDMRNGYHVYWLAWWDPNGSYKPDPEKFDWIEKNIAERLGGDPKAIKKVQLMRMPGTYNHKNGGKYACRIIPVLNNFDRKYVDTDWIELFGEEPEPEPPKYEDLPPIFLPKKNNNDDDIFEYVANLPQEQALAKLSGNAVVNGEAYTFIEVKNGDHLNICINGNQCSSFIDRTINKLFVPSGSGKGSPNVIEWIKWYRPEYVIEPSLLAAKLWEIYKPNGK